MGDVEPGPVEEGPIDEEPIPEPTPVDAIVIEGDAMYDAVTGEVIATVDESKDYVRRAAVAYCGESVLEGGLGFGVSRAAMIAAHKSVRTVELRQSVIDAVEAVPVGDVEEEPIEAVIECMDILDAVRQEAIDREAGADPIAHTIFIDVGEEILDDASFLEDLRDARPNVFDRVVILTQSREPDIPGFKIYPGVETDGLRTWICERWDPEANIGTACRKVWVQGYGPQDVELDQS